MAFYRFIVEIETDEDVKELSFGRIKNLTHLVAATLENCKGIRKADCANDEQPL